MKKTFFLICAFLIIVTTKIFAFEPHFLLDPAISPDGEMVCFSYMGDLWIVPYVGGEAKRITVSEGIDSNPVYSPDGKKIAFNSDREGFNCIYVIPSNGGRAKCISKESFRLCDWFDSTFLSRKELLASGYQIGLGSNLFVVPLNGKRSQKITDIGDISAKLSPDNKNIIYHKRGYTTRERYKGSVNGDLWIYNIKEKKYKKLTNTDFTERYPVYANTKDGIYFVAADFIGSNNAVYQLYFAPEGNFNEREKITNFDTWSVRNLSIAKDNDRIVFEHFDEIWKYNPKTNKVEKLDIEINQDFHSNFDKKEEYTNKVENFAISPDGKLIVFSYKYDLFAMPEKGGEVKQITHNQSGINDIVVMNDNKTIFFTSYIKGKNQIFKVIIDEIDRIMPIEEFKNEYVEHISNCSDDYLIIIYSEESKRYRVSQLNYKTGEINELISNKVVSTNFACSNNHQYAFYFSLQKGSWARYLYLYNFDKKETTLIYPYHGYLGNAKWGEKGEYAFFRKDSNICRIELQAKKDFWDEEDHWQEILNPEEEEEENKKDTIEDNNEKEETEKTEEKNITIDLEDIDKRIKTIISQPGSNTIITVLTDSMIYYLNRFDSEYSLRRIDYKGEKDEKFITFSSEPEHITYNKENESFYYVSDETLKKLNLDKEEETLENNFKYEFNLLRLNKSVFEQAWRIFGKNFYDPDMHGKNWNKLYERYYPYMDYAYSPHIIDIIISEMIGEVNASHTGFYPRRDKEKKQYKLTYGGFEFDYQDIPEKGIKFDKIYKKSKLNKPYNIKSGDILLSVDGKEINEYTGIMPLFLDKIGDKIKMKIQTPDSIKTVEIEGLGWWDNYMMYYDNWVEERKSIVDKETDGTIGYAHIRNMGWSSYKNFVEDIFAKNRDKEALIIDVRNNPGGYIHDNLIEILSKKSYAYTTHRIFNTEKTSFPGDTWDKPVILLINQNSFSDAEIFPILFKQFNFGKVIGMPTSGSVIGTGHVNFMDGSSMRMPSTGWYTKDKINMEGTGAKPDIYIDITPEEKILDNDVQLKKAIEVILEKIR